MDMHLHMNSLLMYTCKNTHKQAIMEKLHELDDAIFNEYIKRKIESIAGIIEQGIQVGYFDWETCGEPQVVRNYVKDVLLNLVLIHSEVYAVSSQIVTRVLNRLVELVSGEFLKKIREVEVFSYNGIIYVSCSFYIACMLTMGALW